MPRSPNPFRDNLIPSDSRRLDADEERSLIVRSQSGRTPVPGESDASRLDRLADARAAEDVLIRHHIRYAVKLANTKSRKHNIDPSDARWLAIGGLYKAISTYDLAYTVRFTTHAGSWILQNIDASLGHFGNAAYVPYCAMVWRKLVRSGRLPYDESATDETKRNRLKYAAAADGSYRIERKFDRDDRVDGLGDDGTVDGGRWAGKSDGRLTSVDRMVADERREWVASFVAKLSERSRHVIERRYGLAGRDRASLTEVGEELGISKERVRHIQIRAVGLLKVWMEADGRRAG